MSSRTKKKKEVIFPLLQKAVEHVDDDHWKTLFDNLSKGNAPKRISVDATSVKFFSKKDGFSYNYSYQEPVEIANQLKILIGKALCLYSKKDLKQQQELKQGESSEFQTVCQLDDWKKVKNKRMKDLPITNFVVNKQKELNLSWMLARLLYNTINSAFYDYHTHKSSDVIMENGNIISIRDIIVDTENSLVYNGRIYEVNEDGVLNLRDDLPDETYVVKKKNLSNEWNKYVNILYKRFDRPIGISNEDETVQNKDEEHLPQEEEDEDEED
jgi:hypothetical protein